MSPMTGDIWILGATGRSGRGVADHLQRAGVTPVLAGRDVDRLTSTAAVLGGAEVVAGTLDQVVARIRAAAPAVVVNTIGPFTRTAAPVIEACPTGTHYVDISNDLPAVAAVLARHDAAVATSSTLVTACGFGVLATESVVLRLCADWPSPARLRVDAIPSVAVEDGVIGTALASTILDGVPAGGRRVKHGRLLPCGVATDPEVVTTPDGDTVTTAALPSGDLLAAWRGSGAASVVAASSEVPSGVAVRTLFPVARLVLRSGVVRRFAIRRLAQVRLAARARPRSSSWVRARAEWADGTVREGWLRLDDALDFTGAAAAEVARRLAAGDGRPGAFTPAALFGADLAAEIGGQFVL